jgi:hypothetical protein
MGGLQMTKSVGKNIEIKINLLVRSKGLFANDNIVDKVLSDSTLVLQVLSGQGRKRSRANGGSRNFTLDNVELADFGIKGSKHGFVRLDGRVDGGENSVGTSRSKFVGNTGRLKAADEFTESIVFLKVGFFLSDGDTLGTPDLSRSFECTQGGHDVTTRSSGTTSGRSGRGGSRRSIGSRGRSSRSRSGGRSGTATSVTHLQVFL